MNLFDFTFVQYAFIAGFFVAILGGLLGPFLVQTRQAIASDMFAHMALAGIGAAVVFGGQPWWGALPTLLIFSTVLWWLSQKDWYSPDALAMFFLSGGLAVALALIHIARDQTFSFEQYLFGSIITVTLTELWIMGGLTLLVAGVVILLWYPLIGATQIPAHVLPHSIRPQIVKLIFFLMLSVVVWVGIKTVGGLLIGALMVIPVLIVKNHVQSFKLLVICCILVSVVSVTLGLFLSLVVDVPPSSLIILSLIFIFCFKNLLTSLLTKRTAT